MATEKIPFLCDAKELELPVSELIKKIRAELTKYEVEAGDAVVSVALPPLTPGQLGIVARITDYKDGRLKLDPKAKRTFSDQVDQMREDQYAAGHAEGYRCAATEVQSRAAEFFWERHDGLAFAYRELAEALDAEAAKIDAERAARKGAA